MYCLIDCNCGIPGADAAVIARYSTETDARAQIANTGQWVEMLPIGVSYRSELTGQWL